LIPEIAITFAGTEILNATPVLLAKENALGLILANGAAHAALVPPAIPLHDQDQGPVPVTVDDDPAEHRLTVGADRIRLPLANPQRPATAETAV
jgi:hypothetical protein